MDLKEKKTEIDNAYTKYAIRIALPLLENNFNTSQLNHIFKQQGVLAEANYHSLMNPRSLLNYFKWMRVHLAF